MLARLALRNRGVSVGLQIFGKRNQPQDGQNSGFTYHPWGIWKRGTVTDTTESYSFRVDY
jgi:hypothetical protein